MGTFSLLRTTCCTPGLGFPRHGSTWVLTGSVCRLIVAIDLQVGAYLVRIGFWRGIYYVGIGNNNLLILSRE